MGKLFGPKCSILLVVIAILIYICMHPTNYSDFDLAARTPRARHEIKRILMPLPKYGFDPTEAAVPWKTLTGIGHEVVFATFDGRPSDGADVKVLNGYLMGLIRAKPMALQAYLSMIKSANYLNPISFTQIDPEEFDGLVLPGGHDEHMIPYLTSAQLQEKVSLFWNLKRPIAAICHGVLVVARARQMGAKATHPGKSLLYGVNTTMVTAEMERAAYYLTKYTYGRYHLSTTWPNYTEDLVRAEGANVFTGPFNPLHTIWLGSIGDHSRSFIVEDGHYLSARFPGDAYLWSQRFATKLLGLLTHPLPSDNRADNKQKEKKREKEDNKNNDNNNHNKKRKDSKDESIQADDQITTEKKPE